MGCEKGAFFATMLGEKISIGETESIIDRVPLPLSHPHHHRVHHLCPRIFLKKIVSVTQSLAHKPVIQRALLFHLYPQEPHILK